MMEKNGLNSQIRLFIHYILSLCRAVSITHHPGSLLPKILSFKPDELFSNEAGMKEKFRETLNFKLEWPFHFLDNLNRLFSSFIEAYNSPNSSSKLKATGMNTNDMMSDYNARDSTLPQTLEEYLAIAGDNENDVGVALLFEPETCDAVITILYYMHALYRQKIIVRNQSPPSSHDKVMGVLKGTYNFFYRGRELTQESLKQGFLNAFTFF